MSCKESDFRQFFAKCRVGREVFACEQIHVGNITHVNRRYRMIRISIGNNLSRKSVIVDENTTVRKALEDSGINHSVGVTTIDGATISAADMDKSLAAMGAKDGTMVLNVAKLDLAASMSVKAGMGFVVSDLSLDDIKLVEKYDPDALVIKDENGDEVYRVGTTCGVGVVCPYGVSFGAHTTNDGRAAVSFPVPDEVSGADAIRAWIVDKVGMSILSLGEVENAAREAAIRVKARLEEIKGALTVE